MHVLPLPACPTLLEDTLLARPRQPASTVWGERAEVTAKRGSEKHIASFFFFFLMKQESCSSLNVLCVFVFREMAGIDTEDTHAGGGRIRVSAYRWPSWGDWP